MTAAVFDIKPLIGQGMPMSGRRVSLTKVIDFSKINGVTGVAANQDCEFAICPQGFIYEDCNVILITPEGGAATLSIGPAGTPTGMLNAGNVNGTPQALVAKAGTETVKPGTPMGGQGLRLTVPGAAATLHNTKVLVSVIGYTVEGLAA